jgi:hypothetical protein
MIVDGYKYYSANVPVGEVQCVGLMAVTKVVKDLAFTGDKITELEIHNKY